ncbi:hypothetical protein FH972_025343 [Carpinus fangiana]|uniref:Uncharacterized protein n=1 Tax=Carpinus fangiana TaxID=176857 RepID=A0A5N6L0R1_9ROSI|nr:hypothetical protein FH972_025343 [Carpinus fangiana]
MKKDLSEIADEVSISGVKERHRQRIAKSQNMVDPMAARKGDLVLYFGDLFPTEARKLPSCPRSHSVNRKGKPTHPSAPLVDRCGFTKRLSTVHSR